MNHLPQMQAPSRKIPPCPYLPSAHALTDNDLDDFPARCRRSAEEHDLSEASHQEISAWLQAWLFFGMLRATLRLYQIPFTEEDFVVRREEELKEPELSTHCLIKYLSEWVSRECSMNCYALTNSTASDVEHAIEKSEELQSMREASISRASKINQYLLVAHSYLCTAENHKGQSLHKAHPVIKDSLVLLLHHLESVARSLFECWRLHDSFWPLARECKLEVLPLLFRSSGWCSHESWAVGELVAHDPSLLLLCAQIDRRPTSHLHHSCDQHGCKAYQIDETTYKTKHADSCDQRNCSFVGFSDRDVAQMMKGLQSDSTLSSVLPTIPMLTYSDGKVKLADMRLLSHQIGGWWTQHLKREFAPSLYARSSRAYAAISHVWADGLGNPHENKLPQCQLRRLQSLVNSHFPEEKHPVPFWIDSICIPLNPVARKQAIQKMSWVYYRAAKIIVLDRELLSTDATNMCPEEIATRIICSSWSRRLWTLQEGLNQERVRYQFKTSSFVARELYQRASTDAMSKLTELLPHELLIESDKQFKNIADLQPESRLSRMLADNLGDVRKNHDFRWHCVLSAPLQQLETCLQGASVNSVFYDGKPINEFAQTVGYIGNCMLRQSTKPFDEGLVFASLVRSKGWEQIVHVPSDQRLRQTYKTLKGFSAALLFLNLERFPEYGDRYIPKTFRSKHVTSVDLQEFADDGGVFVAGYPFAKQPEQGVSVDAVGFNIDQSSATRLPASFYIELSTGRYSALVHLAGSSTPCYDQFEADLAIIFRNRVISGRPRTSVAMLVTILSRRPEETTTMKPYVTTRFEALVDLKRLVDANVPENLPKVSLVQKEANKLSPAAVGEDPRDTASDTAETIDPTLAIQEYLGSWRIG